jgi:uncharacterized protein
MPDAPPRPARSFKLRPLIRALHRDIGYFAVGLTFVYALSGLAVNHISDWDPSFHQIERTHPIVGELPGEDAAIARAVLEQLQIAQEPEEIYRVDATQIDVVVHNRTLHVNTQKREILEEGQEPRFLLRVANWLHLNRGKKAWTWVADGYAAFLLYLATSGLFMLPGKKGLVGRGGILLGLGVLVPVTYVVLSGGP